MTKGKACEGGVRHPNGVATYSGNNDEGGAAMKRMKAMTCVYRGGGVIMTA